MRKGKKIAVVQSSYIPWKGYFDLIAAVDEFVILDEVQYSRGGWRNRNQIKTPRGVQWLTVPVKIAGRFGQSIAATEIDDPQWAQAHWKAFNTNYRQAPQFAEVAELLSDIYLRRRYTYLSDLNRDLIAAICNYLGIPTTIKNSSDYRLPQGKTKRLVELCVQARASQYVSGPAAKDYLDEEMFARAGIEVTWFDYAGYREYRQLWGPFVHNVSIVDLLFNCGPKATYFMKYVRRTQ